MIPYNQRPAHRSAYELPAQELSISQAQQAIAAENQRLSEQPHIRVMCDDPDTRRMIAEHCDDEAMYEAELLKLFALWAGAIMQKLREQQTLALSSDELLFFLEFVDLPRGANIDVEQLRQAYAHRAYCMHAYEAVAAGKLPIQDPAAYEQAVILGIDRPEAFAKLRTDYVLGEYLPEPMTDRDQLN